LKKQSNHWRKPLTDNKKKVLKKDYSDVLKISRGGLLTTPQRKRLLRITKATEGESEKKLWFDIRNSARGAFLDLKLICDVASDNQLQDIFEPLTNDDLPKKKNGQPDAYGKYTRTDVNTFLNTLLFERDNKEWKYFLASRLVETAINYLRWKPEYDNKLHNRVFDDVLDVVIRNIKH